MVKLKYYLVDVFTDQPFGGNQLAVFYKPDGLSTQLMQKIANELNLSETTFVFPPKESKKDCEVRIFTPQTELSMAGHPTVGTAFVLLNQKLIENKNKDFFLFEEGVGDIKVDFRVTNNIIDTIKMNQPLPNFGTTFTDKCALSEMLSIKENQLIPNFPAQVVSCGMPVLLVPVKNLEVIKSIKLQLNAWEKYLSGFESQQIMVFTTETERKESTVHSRFFAPALGIYEDPATGAASGPLGCYLVKYNIIEVREKTQIISEQGYELGRPSKIYIEIGMNGGEINSVMVGGKCIFMGEGLMNIKLAK